MKGKRVIITISEKHYELLSHLTKWNTPREKGKYLKYWLENLIDRKVAENHEEKQDSEITEQRFPGLQLIKNIINKFKQIKRKEVNND